MLDETVETLARGEALGRVVDLMLYSYVALVAGLIGFRALRDWHARRFRAVRISYPGGRVVVVPPGFSVLGASRWGHIPHAAGCGGTAPWSPPSPRRCWWRL